MLLELCEFLFFFSLGSLAFLLLLNVPVCEAAHAQCEAHSVYYHRDGYGFNLGVGVVGEVSDDPPVAFLDECNKYSIEEERDDDQTRAVVPAALHYGVHS